MAEGKRKKKWITSAIKHPGREKERAKEHGISTHAQMEKDKKSDNPSLAKAGALGLRLSAGSKARANRRQHSGSSERTKRLYDNPRSSARKD
jgi:hypothetical protein